MKNIIISVTVGLLTGATVYLLIDYFLFNSLFERPSKSVKDDVDSDQDTTEDVEMEIIQEEPTVSVVK